MDPAAFREVLWAFVDHGGRVLDTVHVSADPTHLALPQDLEQEGRLRDIGVRAGSGDG